MKRYMCRKSIPVSFTAGKVYQVYSPSHGYEKILDSSTCFIDDVGDIDEVSPEVLESHFNELDDDLPVPPDEAYENPMESGDYILEQNQGCARGMATAAAIILSIVVILYSILS